MLVAVLTFASLATGALSQLPTATLEADSTGIRLGDALALRLRLHYGPGTSPALPATPAVAARALLHPGLVEGPVEEGGGQVLTYHYELRVYEPGEYQIKVPPVAFAVSAGDTVWRQPRPVGLVVAGVREAGDEELRDIRGPLPSQAGIPAWLLAVVGALAVVLVAWLAKWGLDRRGRSVVAPSPAPVNYGAEFDRIAAMGLLERGAYKTYYSLLAEVLRHFLEDRLGMEAMERTTEEIAVKLAGMDAPGRELAQRAVAYLAAADLVKFARAIPALDEARGAAREGRAAVLAVDEELARRRDRAAAAAAEAASAVSPAPPPPAAA